MPSAVATRARMSGWDRSSGVKVTTSHVAVSVTAPTQPSGVDQAVSAFGVVQYHQRAPNPVAADLALTHAAVQHHRNRLRNNASSEVPAASRKAAAAAFGTQSLYPESAPNGVS